MNPPIRPRLARRAALLGLLLAAAATQSRAAEISAFATGGHRVKPGLRAVLLTSETADEAVEMSGEAVGDRILLRIYSPRSGGTRYLVVDNTKH